ncbi:hypothetical protein ACJMK2_004402 [Sinanodonta woodiana]|uniref:CARD domain-containing protein n=1 Tax=Sinanodonta woodiana TaxID=1069815 RepID=A0ABD3Y3A2_SINWO
MDTNHKKALQRNHKALCDELELGADLEANLVHCGLFSEEMLDEIKAEKSRKQRIQKMLKALRRRGPDAFDKFLSCIHELYPWLEQKLTESYQDEVNNRAPSSADLNLQRKVDLMVHNTFGKKKKFCKDDKQEISNFLLMHCRQNPRQDYDGSHSDHPEQEILRKIFFMLTSENINGVSTAPLSVPEEISLDTIAIEISRLSEKIRSLEKQLDYYKTIEIGDTTKSLEEIVNLAATNELKLKASQEELTQLQERLSQKDLTINENLERIQNLYSKIEELNLKCTQLKQKESLPQMRARTRPIELQKAPFQIYGLVHDDVVGKDNSPRFPSLRHQTNISQQHTEVKFKSERFPNGIGVRASNSHRPSKKY